MHDWNEWDDANEPGGLAGTDAPWSDVIGFALLGLVFLILWSIS